MLSSLRTRQFARETLLNPLFASCSPCTDSLSSTRSIDPRAPRIDFISLTSTLSINNWVARSLARLDSFGSDTFGKRAARSLSPHVIARRARACIRIGSLLRWKASGRPASAIAPPLKKQTSAPRSARDWQRYVSCHLRHRKLARTLLVTTKQVALPQLVATVMQLHCDATASVYCARCWLGLGLLRMSPQPMLTRPLQKYNLAKGETPASTTDHGLFFLEQIRRTADKRSVAPVAPSIPYQLLTPG